MHAAQLCITLATSITDSLDGENINLCSGRYVSVFGINETHNELNPVFYDKEVLTLDTSGEKGAADTKSHHYSDLACGRN